MVDLPLGATEDRVCGTIDIEKALTEGIIDRIKSIWAKTKNFISGLIRDVKLFLSKRSISTN